MHRWRGKPISIDHHTLVTIMLDCKKAGLKNENYSRITHVVKSQSGGSKQWNFG
jgi:hypothetical protein